MKRNEAEEKAIKKIQNLNESDFQRLGKMIRSSNWEYVGSNGNDDGDEAYWMRFSNEFEMISSTSYGENYFLVQETTMDLSTLKCEVDSVISFGDCTSNGDWDADNETHLASIIESVAFSLLGHGGHNETVYNEDLTDMMAEEKIDYQTAVNNCFAKIAHNRDIPFKK